MNQDAALLTAEVVRAECSNFEASLRASASSAVQAADDGDVEDSSEA